MGATWVGRIKFTLILLAHVKTPNKLLWLPMNDFHSDSTNTIVHFVEILIYTYGCGQGRTQFV